MTTPDARRDALLDVACGGERRACFDLARQWEAEGITAREFYNDIVLRALAELGHRWERNELSIAEEHIATEIIREVVAFKASAIRPALADKGIALVGCVPGEQHDIAGLILSNLLEEDGWSTRFFGQSVPKEDIVALAARMQPALACLIARTLPRLDSTVELAREIGAASPRTRIIVGGIDSPALRSILRPYVHGFADCPVTAVTTANSLAG